NVSSESVAILPTFVEPDGGDGDSTLRVVWGGILGDWESATHIPASAHGADQCTQQPERTPAAWRHMSVASLSDRFHITRTADEIESFFHVILHNAIR
ncbi:hypothetical protein LXA43DRAFT_844405, partial [Ganoderma leucocontextum]